MEAKRLKYNLSKDYNRLFSLLKKEYSIIGVVTVNLGLKQKRSHPSTILMTYDYEKEAFILGDTYLFECDFDLDGFVKYCEKEDIRFFMPNEMPVKRRVGSYADAIKKQK